MNKTLESKVLVAPIEVNIGVDPYGIRACTDALTSYYKELQQVRGWLLTHIDDRDESVQVLNRFRTAHAPIHNALATCSPVQRNLLELLYAEQKSPELVEHELQMNPDDVDRTMFQAFQILTSNDDLMASLG